MQKFETRNHRAQNFLPFLRLAVETTESWRSEIIHSPPFMTRHFVKNVLRVKKKKNTKPVHDSENKTIISQSLWKSANIHFMATCVTRVQLFS